METNTYDHYIAIDWSIVNMAIARMTHKSNKITVIDIPSDLARLKEYLKELKGKKILTLEETDSSQWLYTELKEWVEKILICDPHRNHLLKEGSKTDKQDAMKLVQLLKSDLLKEVYHSGENFLQMRKLVSAYDDLIKNLVRLKNQRQALLRASGQRGKTDQELKWQAGSSEPFVLEKLNQQISLGEKTKQAYVEQFSKLAQQHPAIQHQKSLPGIRDIHAVHIIARVVTPYRFSNKGQYWSYSGLVKLPKESGGKSYGKRSPRYCRELKYAYKMAVASAVGGNNPINDYYEYLIQEKQYPEHQARHKACRQLALWSWGVFKSGKKFEYKQICQKMRKEERQESQVLKI